MATTTKERAEIFMLPEGRVINASLFVKDIYVDPTTKKEGKPLYKIEMAYDPKDVTGEGTIEDKILDCIEANCGKQGADDYLDFLDRKPTKFKWTSPFKEGDALAAARSEKGKEGDAYKGKLILRANCLFNAAGADAPGGVAVYGPDTHKIGIVEGNTDEVFNGCYGKLAITLKYWDINGNRYVATYISAFQMTRGTDADRLSTAGDKSTLFTPVGGSAANDGTSGRRRRAG